MDYDYESTPALVGILYILRYNGGRKNNELKGRLCLLSTGKVNKEIV